jgi:hypothetical protein
VWVLFVSGFVLIFIVGFFIFKETDYLLDAFLSTDHLKIVMKNRESENLVFKYDWISISDLSLMEKIAYPGFSEYVLYLWYTSSFTKEVMKKVFPLRKFNRDPEKQQLLYQRINAFWVKTHIETIN